MGGGCICQAACLHTIGPTVGISLDGVSRTLIHFAPSPLAAPVQTVDMSITSNVHVNACISSLLATDYLYGRKDSSLRCRIVCEGTRRKNLKKASMSDWNYSLRDLKTAILAPYIIIHGNPSPDRQEIPLAKFRWFSLPKLVKYSGLFYSSDL